MEKIVEYITGRINGLKAKQATIDSPITQDIIEKSSALQLEQVRRAAQLEELENILLTINIFSKDKKEVKGKIVLKAKKLPNGGTK